MIWYFPQVELSISIIDLQGVSLSMRLSQVVYCTIWTHQVVWACRCYTQSFCYQKKKTKNQQPNKTAKSQQLPFSFRFQSSPYFSMRLKTEAAFLSVTASELWHAVGWKSRPCSFWIIHRKILEPSPHFSMKVKSSIKPLIQ